MKEERTQQSTKCAYIAHTRCMKGLVDMFSHEINQPLMVISAYASGCILRLEENAYDKKQIIDAMKTVNQQVARAGMVIELMKDCIDVECEHD